MKRSSPIKRTPPQPSRQRIKPVSDKRREANKVRAAAMIERFGPRDEWLCDFPNAWALLGSTAIKQPGPCRGAVNGHEVLKRSRGGSITDPANVVLLCNFHNGFVEDAPLLAHALGLAKHSWET